ncbi:MAG TPA: serine/threonine-protein kinase [Thermoanaerobaculia bacterium]
MSFRVWKRQSTPTPSSRVEGVVAAAPVASLPPAVVTAGARRLAPLALLLACVNVFFALLDRLRMHEPTQARTETLWLFAVVAGIGLSLLLAWIASREMLSPERLLDWGLGYEVAQALLLSLSFHHIPPPANYAPRGWTGVAVWILAYPLIIPNTRTKTLIATAAAAVMDPLGLLINAAVAERAIASPVWLQFGTTIVAAGTAIYVSGIVYQITLEAGKGNEMGAYNLETLLGRGGMGEVWRASHRLLARRAAIKLIRPDALGSDSREWLRRFEREAKATAGLHSPHTVDIYDYGTTEDGTFYYVMELLEGFDTETLVTEFGPLPAERAIFILIQACQSLAEAHQGGLIHRDVKPANIYVCRYGLEWDFVKILDFGLVKTAGLTDERGRQLTVAGMIAGTPGYMSPEIGSGSPDVDWRADVYAIGCVAYWLVTGQPVFDGTNPMQIVMAHIQKQPVPPSRRTTIPIPEALEQIILDCLRKDPNERPQTMQELALRLGRVPLEHPWSDERARQWWMVNGNRVGKLPAAKHEAVSSSSQTPPIAAGQV